MKKHEKQRQKNEIKKENYFLMKAKNERKGTEKN